MPARHPIPALWLVTDERQGDALWPAIARLPRGSGIVVRHHATPGRVALIARIRRIARRRGLTMLIAAPRDRAGRWTAAGQGLSALAAHGPRDLVAARRAGCAFAFLSPAFPTRTHPGAPALGSVRFGLAARRAPLPVIALGGMTGGRFRRVRPLGAHGWAAIDGLTLSGRDA